MNIFVLDRNIQINAQYHNDKHVVKMIVESAQLLSSAYYFSDNIENFIFQNIYKKTHVNHPCSIWTRENINNWNWLLMFAKELCIEYTFRYNKIHKTQTKIEFMENHPPNLSDNTISEFIKAMPDYIKNVIDDPILAYRQYYILEKQHIATWKNRKTPEWFVTKGI